MPADRLEEFRKLVDDRRLDRKLSDLVCGEHDLTIFNHNRADHRELLVVYLEELRLTFEALLAAGWARHTSDWDFQILVTTKDGKQYEDYNSPYSFWVTPYLEKEFEKSKIFTACVDYKEVIGLNVGDDRPGPNSGLHIGKQVQLGDLKSIYIEELH